MRYLNKLVCAALIAGATATPVFAQGGGGAPGGGGGGAPAGGGGGGLGGSMGGGGGSSPGGGTALQGTSLSTLGATPQISAPTVSGGNSGNSVSTSNFLAQYYGNPYYQGVLTNSQSNNNSPGGFGAVLFNSSGGSGGGGQIGYAGGSGGGGRTGTTAPKGGGTSSTNNNNSGVVIPLPYQISYAAVPDFKIDPLSAAQIQATVIADLRRSKEVSYPSTVSISTDGNVVTIRGNTKDRKEARAIEAMIKMTPGVRGVKNELSYPKEEAR